MTAPLVSVVMPAYNAARWLEQAMTSVLVQTHRDLELVVVDDASTDATPDIVTAFRDSRVRHLRLAQNGGVGRALNAGLAAARGELVARLDADDYAFCDRLARQVAVLSAQPDIAVLGGNAQEVTGEGRTLRARFALFEGRGLHWAVSVWCPLIHPTVVMRRAALPDGGYPGVETTMEDWAMWMRMSRTHRIENDLAPVIVYRRHPAAVSFMPKARPPGAPLFRDHLREAFGLDVDPTTAAAWMRTVNAPAVTRPGELAELAERLAPDAMPYPAHVPPWTSAGLARARRAHLRWLLDLARHGRARPDLLWHLAPVIARAAARVASGR